MARIGIALALILGGLLTGCGGTVCEDAVDKLAGECGLGSASAVPLGNGTLECEDDSDTGRHPVCASECILEYECTDITDKQDENNPYTKCLGKCLTKN